MKPGSFDSKSLATRLAVELGPVFLFFGLVQWQGIFLGTAAFIVATIASAAVSWYREQRLPVVPLIGAAFAVLFGGATLILHDPLWIVMRPTVFNIAAAAVLLVSMQRGWLILKSTLGRGVSLPDATWIALTWRLICFFMFLAVSNEVVWRTFGLDAWISFKAFAVPALNLAFLAGNWVSLKGSGQRVPVPARA